MSGMQSFNCVKSEVPSSFSFHSLSVRPAEYDPGLATLTLRVQVRSGRGSKGDHESMSGEVRIVHGTAEIHNVVETSIKNVFNSEDQTTGEEPGTNDEDTPDEFWVRLIGGSIQDESVRSRFVLDLFSGLSSISWDVISSCNLTRNPSNLQTYEMFTWILKRKMVPAPGIECIAISLRRRENENILDILSPNCSIEINNLVKSCVEQGAKQPKNPNCVESTSKPDRRSVEISHKELANSLDKISTYDSTTVMETRKLIEHKITSDRVESSVQCSVETNVELHHVSEQLSYQDNHKSSINSEPSLPGPSGLQDNCCVEQGTPDTLTPDEPIKTGESGYISEEDKKSEEELVQKTEDIEPVQEESMEQKDKSANSGDYNCSQLKEPESDPDLKESKVLSEEKSSETETKQISENDTKESSIHNTQPTVESETKQPSESEIKKPSESETKQPSESETKQPSESETNQTSVPTDEKTITSTAEESIKIVTSQTNVTVTIETHETASREISKFESNQKEIELKELEAAAKVNELSAKISNLDRTPRKVEFEAMREGSPGKGVVLRNKAFLSNIIAPPLKFRESQDDPLCPSQFRVGLNLNLVLLDLSYKMFSRQWKLVTCTRLQGSQESLLLFQHDSRILPGIGQQALAGLSIGEDGVELFNISSEIAGRISGDLGLERKEGFLFSAPADESALYSNLVFSFGQHSYNIFSSIQSPTGSLIMFRSSNLVASSTLTLHLVKGNTIRLSGATLEEVNVIREVLRSRWPYAISLDHQLLKDGEVQKDVEVKDADNKDREVKDVSKKDGEIKDGSDIEPGAKKPCEPVDDGSRKSSGSENTVSWEWKVRRYPWRISYGARLVDRAVEKAGRVLSLPSPKHQDLESAKSVIIFAMKELSERGWKFSGVFSSDTQTYVQFIK